MGGLTLYLNKEKLCKFLNNHPIVPNAEIIWIEFYQLKREWLLLGCYRSPTQKDLKLSAPITKVVDFYLQKFENWFIIGDSNLPLNANDLFGNKGGDCLETGGILPFYIKFSLKKGVSNWFPICLNFQNQVLKFRNLNFRDHF